MDEQLIGGLLTAIHSFGKDVFAGSATDQITYQDFSVMLKAVGELMFCYIYKDPSLVAREKLDLFVESVRTSAIIWEDLTMAIKKRVFLRSTDKNQLDQVISYVFEE